MSRVFRGSPNRDFLKSPNRDRITDFVTLPEFCKVHLDTGFGDDRIDLPSSSAAINGHLLAMLNALKELPFPDIDGIANYHWDGSIAVYENTNSGTVLDQRAILNISTSRAAPRVNLYVEKCRLNAPGLPICLSDNRIVELSETTGCFRVRLLEAEAVDLEFSLAPPVLIYFSPRFNMTEAEYDELELQQPVAPTYRLGSGRWFKQLRDGEIVGSGPLLSCCDLSPP